MEYIPLNKLPNKYPSVTNYSWEDGSYIILDGEYPTNYIAFRKPFLSQLKWVAGTSFKFIVNIKTSNVDPYQQFYTSEAYYKLLEKALLDNNPYFPKLSFKKENIIDINVSDALSIFFNRNTEEEGKYGVRVFRNFFCESDLKDYFNGINYENLIKYLDWLLSSSAPYDIDQGGVLPAVTNSKYEILEYNSDLGVYQTKAEYDYYFAVIQLNEMIELVEQAIAEFRACYKNPTQESLDRIGKYTASLTAAGAALGGGALVGAFAAVAAITSTAAGSVVIATTAGLVSVPAGTAAALAGTIGIGGTATAASAQAAAATAPAGPIVAVIAAAVVLIVTFIIGSNKQKEAERRRDEALEKVRQYCLTNISKLEKDLENYKFLLKELVEANTTRIKIQNASTEADGTIIPSVTNFIYDDNRIQTNIRKQYTF
jgi:hypothetical protein